MLETRRHKKSKNDGKTRKTGHQNATGICLNIGNFNDYFINEIHDFVGESLTVWSRDNLRLAEVWILLLIHIMEGLRHLHTNKKAHGNLTCDTVFVDLSGNCRILYKTTFYENFIGDLDYKPVIDSRAPEMDILTGLGLGPGLRLTLSLSGSELLDDIYEKKTALQTIDNIFYNYMLESFLDSVDIRDKADFIAFFDKYAMCSDIWSLGQSLLDVYLNLISDPEICGLNFYRNNHRAQMKVFEGMLNPDPRKRYTVDMVLNDLYGMRMDSS